METGRFCGGIREIRGGQNSVEIDELARFAIEEHNKKQNALLKFGKVMTARQQVVAGLMYYITLEAAEGGSKKVYDAKIWVKPWMNWKSVNAFELVGDTSSTGSTA